MVGVVRTKQEYIERHGVEAYERYKEQQRRRNKQYYATHKEEKKQYYTEHREKINTRQRQYNAAHKKEIAEQMKQHRTTPIGRANCLTGRYRQTDKQKGFLNIDNQVDSNFILNNIFTKSCIYCGESDWKKLGCDRIDNSKPHTIDNVVCSCWDCNHERNAMNFDEFMAMKKAAA